MHTISLPSVTRARTSQGKNPSLLSLNELAVGQKVHTVQHSTSFWPGKVVAKRMAPLLQYTGHPDSDCFLTHHTCHCDGLYSLEDKPTASCTC